MRVLAGRAGTGKTNQILQEIAEFCARGAGKQMILVPELYSHQYERRLSETTENMGARTAEVLTFSRLCDRVFSEVGGLCQQSLDPAGQLLTMRKAVGLVQAGLSGFDGLAEKTPMLREVLAMVEECKHYGVPPEAMFASTEEVEDEGLRQKLSDFAQIYTAYDRLCSESLPDPRDRLTRLAEAVPQSQMFDGVQLYLDGFYGFTGQEYAVIASLLTKAADVTFGLLYDPKEQDLFPSGSKTMEHLRRLARKTGAPLEVVPMENPCIAYPAGIAALEREILHPVPTHTEAKSDGFAVYEALSPFEECEHVAATICALVRDAGYRYRDIIVAARNMDAYSALLNMAMARYDVPIFYAEKEDLLQKPPFLFLLSAMRAATGSFAYEEMFACLKTGLTPLSDDEVDTLENYVLTWRIAGNKWFAPFALHPEGYRAKASEKSKAQLAYLNSLRERIAPAFLALKEGMLGRGSVGERVRVLYAFLTEMQMPQQMQARADALEAEGAIQRAEEYRQLWEILVSALEQFAWVSDEQAVSGDEFVSLFSMVLGEYDVGTIPVSIDRVACGPIDRVCGEHHKVLFLLGVSEGVFPQGGGTQTLFSEFERDLMEMAGLSLKETGLDALLREQELAYRAITCPTERLYWSYPLTDTAGGNVNPSFILGQVYGVLPNCTRESYVDCREADRLQAEATCVELACEYIAGKKSPQAYAAFLQYAKDSRVVRAAMQQKGRGGISKAQVLHALYGKTIGVTASRVDTFYSCEFAHFMQYGLVAKERKVAKFDALEVGTFLHYVLEHAMLRLSEEAGGAVNASGELVRRVCRQVTKQYVEEELGGMENKTARFRYIFRRLSEMALEVVQSVIDELQKSAFAPIDFELNFAEGGDLPPVTVQSDQGAVSLSGKVDRVDGYIKDGRLYLRVMDYKSGKKSFSLSDVWYGLNMQMILYLFALEDAGLPRYQERISQAITEVVPAGMLYVPARTEVVEVSRDESEDKIRAMKAEVLRRKGLLAEDMDILDAMEKGVTGQAQYLPIKFKKDGETLDANAAVTSLARFGKLARFAQKKLLQMGEELAGGAIRANPIQRDKTSLRCTYCAYRAACHFDEALGDNVHKVKDFGDKVFWESLEQEVE